MIGVKTAEDLPFSKVVFCATSQQFSDIPPNAYYTGWGDILPLIVSTALGDYFIITLDNGSYWKIEIIGSGTIAVGDYKTIQVTMYLDNDTSTGILSSTTIYTSGSAEIKTKYVYLGIVYPITVTTFEDVTKFNCIAIIAENGELTVAPTINITGTIKTKFLEFFNGTTPVIFFPGEESEEGGGTGEFDSSSDDIPIPALPSLSAVNSGFITLYAPTLSQITTLATYMWSENFDIITEFKKIFANPIDAIIGVSIVPVSVPVTGSQEVKIGFIGTGISMNVASSQFVTVDCGSITLKEFWGNALDYSPFTKVSLYLPFIGTRELNTDDVMDKTINVVYHIDILSGSCTVLIKCGGAVIYQYAGACATAIPVNGNDWTSLLTACVQLAGVVTAVVATGGGAAGLLPSASNAVTSLKPNVQRTGAVSGSAGLLGVQKPYIILERPRQSLAKNYNKYNGYPSNITALLSTLTGYTEVDSIHLSAIPATETELTEIEALLKTGVII